MSGQWVEVQLSDGSVRQDWVPDDQPPAPDGGPGRWHVVESPEDTEPRWEWHAAPSGWTPRSGSAGPTLPVRGQPPGRGGEPPSAPAPRWDPDGLPGARDPRWNPWRAAARPFVIAGTTLATLLVVIAVGLGVAAAVSARSSGSGFSSGGEGGGGLDAVGAAVLLVAGALLIMGVLVVIGLVRLGVIAWRITAPV